MLFNFSTFIQIVDKVLEKANAWWYGKSPNSKYPKIKSTPNEIEVLKDVCGFEKKDLKIEIEFKTLIVSGKGVDPLEMRMILKKFSILMGSMIRSLLPEISVMDN